MTKKKSAKKEKETPKVNKDLNGFDIKVNSFGEIVTSYDLDKVNEFLDKNVDDKKLKNRSELLQKKVNKLEQSSDSDEESSDEEKS
jgi:hypothetical protein